MGTMNEKQTARFETQLRKLASRMLADVAVVAEHARGTAGGQGATELSNVPMHLADNGTDENLYDLNATLLENEAYLATEATEALHRIEQGTFGICEQCGEKIAIARLDAIPYTRYCLQCAETAEDAPAANLNAGRPRDPSDTLAPEGEMGEDRHRRRMQPAGNATAPDRPLGARGDIYAAGTAGGGTAVGGLAGANTGNGDPDVADLQDAMGSSNFDINEARENPNTPRSGRAGGAVGGTPAGKRTRSE
jgi:RNA polymerase-binding transcription factor DksA